MELRKANEWVDVQIQTRDVFFLCFKMQDIFQA